LQDFMVTSALQRRDSKHKVLRRNSQTQGLKDAKIVDSDDEPFLDEQKKEKSHRRRAHRRVRQLTTASADDVDPNLTPKRTRGSNSFCDSATQTQFHPRTRLPYNSSPAPLKRTPLANLAQKLKEAISFADNSGADSSSSDSECIGNHKNASIYGNSHSNSGLLCNFEESALNGRLEPVSTVDGFRLQIAVTGTAFSVPHISLPVTTYFFNVSDDDAPSLYLGHCSLKDEASLGRKALHIPKKCLFQATLFNPQGRVVRIFIIRIDVADIPTRSRTFIRQRTYATPHGDDGTSQFVSMTTTSTSTSTSENPRTTSQASSKNLRYLINLRLATDRAGKLYLHTDIRMLFANKDDLDVISLGCKRRGPPFTLPQPAATLKCGVPPLNETSQPREQYNLITATEMPQGPKYSPIK